MTSASRLKHVSESVASLVDTSRDVKKTFLKTDDDNLIEYQKMNIFLFSIVFYNREDIYISQDLVLVVGLDVFAVIYLIVNKKLKGNNCC